MKRGFTLLELLISCALLLAILGILATTINRAHQIRQEATRRTTLLTQGRAVLDFIANDLQSIIATNLDIIGEQGYRDYPAFTNTLHFTKTITLADTDPGSANNALPAERIRYFVATNDYPKPRLQGYALYRQTGAWSNDAGTASVAIGQRAEPVDFDTRDYPVTNIVAGSGTTRLPPASAGETIQVPVNSSGSTRIYDWETSTSAWVDVVPADATGLTNRIETTVVFTSSYTQLTTNIIERPPTNTVVWPAVPQTTVSTGFQSLVRQTVADLAVATGTYTNSPVYTTFWTNHLARLTGTNLQQIVQTNEVTHAVTTNAVPVVWTNDFFLASWTGAWVTVQNGLPPDTTTPVRVAWATTNLPPLFFSNFWNRVDRSTTNRLDALVDDQWDETRQTWQLAVNPIIDLTNFPWRLSYSLTNSFFYPPPDATNIPWMPLALDAYEILDAAGNSSEWSTRNFYAQTAVGTTPLLPAPAQQRRHWVETVITNQITGTRMVSVILETFITVVTNRLTALVPASLVGTNRYAYESGPVYRSGFNTVNDNATTWIPVVLQNDFEGADVEIHSLWLEPGQRSGQSFDYEPRNIYGLVGERGDDWDPPMTDPQLLLDGIAACYFQVLAFKEESGEPLLEPWSPGDTEPPVCIDIYLELIDPAIGRRAATMAPKEAAAFVRRHVVRLTKRVPLQTHNRWRSP
jgi:type II secretory pathway pseudopilin PulG